MEDSQSKRASDWRFRRAFAVLVSILVLGGGFGVSMYFYIENRESTLAQLRELVVRDAVSQGTLVKNRIQGYERSMAALREVLLRDSDMEGDDFRRLAARAFPDLQAQAAVVLADVEPGGGGLRVRSSFGSQLPGASVGAQLGGDGEETGFFAVGGPVSMAVEPGISFEFIRGEDGSLAHFLLFLYPIESDVPDSPASLLAGMFSVQALMESSLDAGVRFSYDVMFFTERSPGDRQLLFYSPAVYREVPQLPDLREAATGATQRFTLQVGGDQGVLVFTPSTQWLRRNESPLPKVIFVLGMLLTSSVGSVFLFKARREREVRRQVAERTAELALSHRNLDESRSTLSSVLEACPEGILGLDGEDRWTFANRAYLEMAGIPERVDCIGRTSGEILARAKHANRDLLVLSDGDPEGVLPRGKPGRLESSVTLADGGQRHLDIHASPIRDREGKLVGRVVIHSDITELRRRINALQRSRERVQLLVSGTATAIVEWDTKLRIIGCNPAAEKLFGCDVSEMKGQGVEWFCGGGEGKEAARALRSCLEDRKILIPQVREHITRRGVRITCEWQNTPLIGEDGTVLGITSFIYNITERERAALALRKRDVILSALASSSVGFLEADGWEQESRELLRKLVETLGLSRVFLVRTPEGGKGGAYTLVEWSHPTRSAGGGDRASDSGQDDLHERLGGGQLPGCLVEGREIFGHAADFPEPMRSLFLAQDAVSVLVLPVILQTEGLWGFLRFDQCEREREWSGEEIDAMRVVGSVLGGALARQALTKERLQMEKRLLLAQKRESLGLLAGSLARDFNGLLTGMLGNASLARAVAETDSEIDNCLAEIETAGLRAAALCREMLAFSGRSESHTGLVSPNLIVLDVLNTLEREAGNNLSIRKDLADGLPVIDGDIGQLREAIGAVLRNAVEAVGSGRGVVRVTTRPAPSDGGVDWVAIQIEDTGPGMDAGTRDRALDPFFSTKMAGRGLGLPHAFSAVEAHCGRLIVDSEPGRGTIVTLLLPSRRPEASPKVPKPEEVPGDLSVSGRALLVGEGGSATRQAADGLRRIGFQVVEVGGIDEALRNTAQHLAHYRLVAVEPAADGVEPATLNRLRRLGSSSVLLLLTAPGNCPSSLRHFASEGMAVMVAANASIEEMREAVFEVLSGVNARV